MKFVDIWKVYNTTTQAMILAMLYLYQSFIALKILRGIIPLTTKKTRIETTKALLRIILCLHHTTLASSIVNRLIMTFTPRRMNMKSIYIQYQDDKDSIIVDSIIHFYRCLTVFWKRKTKWAI